MNVVAQMYFGASSGTFADRYAVSQWNGTLPSDCYWRRFQQGERIVAEHSAFDAAEVDLAWTMRSDRSVGYVPREAAVDLPHEG
mmetsp:Transcript_16070/g.26090  ORF Transcript_16070/g.26090 Transcript_16070/m.26090 type:complete len:84 (-) Transcript_16070:125-376(-)